MRMCPHRIGEQVDFHTADDPNNLWPQTQWNQVQGSFPLASSGSHALGSSGGAEDVTLTASQIPKHRHLIRNASGQHTLCGTGATQTADSTSWCFTDVKDGANADGSSGKFWAWDQDAGGVSQQHDPIRRRQQVEARRLAVRRVA